MTAVVIVEAVVIALLVILVAGLLKSHAEILQKLDRLEPRDDPAPRQLPKTTGMGQAPTDRIAGVDPSGVSVSISLSHERGEGTLLAFLTTGCASCRVFWSELGEDREMPTPNTRPVIVTKGPGAESPSRLAALTPDGTSVVMSDEAWDVFRVPLTPYFMLIDGDGEVLGEGSASTLEHLVSLFRQAHADADPTHLGTREREGFTDDRLRKSGVEPGDRSLYEDPLR